MSASKQRLYDLLPTYIRFRDQQMRDPELGIAPLEALMKVLEVPFHALEENIDALYQGWFIETCDQWKVPYLADLLGIRGLDESGAMLPSQRTRVANTIAYRRRKGTPAALARAAEDVTGWPCHLTEMRDLSAVQMSLTAPRPLPAGTVDLRRQPELDALGTPFDRQAYTVDLRHGRKGRSEAIGAGYQPNNLTLCFWRLESYPMRHCAARPSASDPRNRFRFHPSGVDTRLFNLPQTPDFKADVSQPRHLPRALERRELAREVAALRATSATMPSTATAWTGGPGAAPRTGYFRRDPVFRIRVREADDSSFQEIPPTQIEICDLSDWSRPHPEPDWSQARLAVDPVIGRMVFPPAEDGSPSRQVLVDYCYGLSGDLGGGPYPRRLENPTAEAAAPKGWQAIVDLHDEPGIEGGILRFGTLQQALEAWRDAPASDAANAVIRIADNGCHQVGQLEIALEGDQTLTFEAEERCWPHLIGNLSVRGQAGSRLRLDGLGVEGCLQLFGQPSISLRHSTVHPPARSPAILMGDAKVAGRQGFEVEIESSILTGPIQLPTAMLGLKIADSILDAAGGEAIRGTADQGPASYGPPARIDRTTVFGRVKVHQLWRAANSLFVARLETARPREGQATHSYFHNGSITPPREHCLEGPRTPSGGWLRPAFTSTDYGQPGYGQLTSCSHQLIYGGEHGNEIGAFHRLRQSDRKANLQAILDEFLPAGFTSRISFAS